MIEQLKTIKGLFKPEDVIMVVFAVYCGAAIATRSWTPFQNLPYLIMSMLVANLIMLAGGHLLNQYYDREEDKLIKSYRPIAAGRISPVVVKKAAIILFALALVLSALMGLDFFLLSIFGSFMSASYSAPKIHIKTRLVLRNAGIGLFYGIWTFLMGWAVYAPPVASPLWFLLFLFLFESLSCTTKDFMDYKAHQIGSRIIEINTIPRKFGFVRSALVIFICYELAFIFLMLSVANLKFLAISVYGLFTGFGIFVPMILKQTKKRTSASYAIAVANAIVMRVLLVWAFLP